MRTLFTEIMVSLREAVLQVARHFMSMDPKLSKIALEPDYSMESHARDHEIYVNVSRNRKRRAKALLGKIMSFFLLIVVTGEGRQTNIESIFQILRDMMMMSLGSGKMTS